MEPIQVPKPKGPYDYEANETPGFARAVAMLLALHKLIQMDQDDSPVGEGIRDAIDECKLTPQGHERLQWISEGMHIAAENPQ